MLVFSNKSVDFFMFGYSGQHLSVLGLKDCENFGLKDKIGQNLGFLMSKLVNILSFKFDF